MAKVGPGSEESERETKAGETQAEKGLILKSICFYGWILEDFKGNYSLVFLLEFIKYLLVSFYNRKK